MRKPKKIKAITNTENAELKWKSNDESIVKIVGNSTNEITIKGVAVGKAQIQAYLEIKNKSGQIEKVKTEVCNITVVSESQTPVEEIDFSMISGEQKRTIDLSSPVTTCELKPIIYPESARDSVELEWESSNPEVASVDENGIVTGNKNGTAVITVRTNNGKHAETTVEVQTSPTEIVLNAAELQIDIAQAQHTKLEAAIKPVTANVKTGITWSSSNSDVASVNQTGEVEAKSTGKTVISVVTENGCATDCTITVIDSSKYAVPDPSNPSSPTGAPDTTQSPSDDTFPWWLVAGAAAGVGEDTIMKPDEVIYNKDQNVMIYKKEYPFNISTSDTPTGTHRVFIPLNTQGKKTIRMSQFPLVGGN